MSSNNDLTPTGNSILASIASVMVNFSAQPFAAMKTRVAERQPILDPRCKTVFAHTRSLYRGATALTIAEIAQYILMYQGNSMLGTDGKTTWASATFGGVVGAIPIAIGETIMIEQIGTQRNLVSCMKEAIRVNGLRFWFRSFAITAAREVPYASGMFVLPDRIKPYISFTDENAKAFTAGLLSGMVIAPMTIPIDLIKTRVQGQLKLTIAEACRSLAQDLRTPIGRILVLKFSLARTAMLTMSLGVGALINNFVPQFLPKKPTSSGS